MNANTFPSEQPPFQSNAAHMSETLHTPRQWEELQAPEQVELMLLTLSQKEGQEGLRAADPQTETSLLEEAGIDFSRYEDPEQAKAAVQQVLQADHVVKVDSPGRPSTYWINTSHNEAVLQRLGTTKEVGAQRHQAYLQEKRARFQKVLDEYGGMNGLMSLLSDDSDA